MTLAELFNDLQLHLTSDLLRRIKSGEATAAELGVARQLLRDNHIDVPKTDPHIAALAQAAAAAKPHLDDDDILAARH